MGVRLVVRSCWTQRSDAAEVRFEFDQARIVVGRSGGADVQLPHPAVSATHATLRAHGPGYAIVDEDSTNGTRVNGKRIAPGRPKPLRSGDRIEIGGFLLQVELAVAVAPMSAEDTAELARRLVRDALDPDGGGAIPPPRVTVLNGDAAGAVLELPRPPASVVLGRSESCDLVLPDADASREHVELVRDHEGVLARDLDSKNGLSVNGRAVLEVRLRDRDELVVGATHLVFEDPAREALAELPSQPDAELPLPEPLPEPPSELDGAAADTPADTPDDAPDDAPDEPPAGPAPGTDEEPSIPEAQLLDVPKSSGPAADLIVYVLAGAVLALSIAGLLWLFG